MKTREKILLASLQLFNESGEPNVTTLDVATELDISPGNLYYHFKGKDALVAELFARLESELIELQLQEGYSGEALLDLSMYLQLSLESMARYIFLYRDVSDLLSRYPSIQRRFKALLARQRKSLRLLCASMQQEGTLTVNAGNANHLVEHMTMTMNFWPNYQRVQSKNIERFTPDLADCAYQVVTLLMPYLDKDSQQAVVSLAADYR